MDIEQQRQADVLVIAPSGRIDSNSSDPLQVAVIGALEGGTRRLVIDFARVDYISSAGLRVMLVAAKRLGGGQGTLVLCGLQEPVRQVFDLAGFLPLFIVEGTRQAALGRLGGVTQ